MALRFRIGIHVGDVMVRGGDLLGDGVNVAARLEGLAEPGGVCISGDAHRQVKKAVSLAFKDLGPQLIKNIDEPVYVYAVVIARQGPVHQKAEPARKALPLPDKPSIAVLPFTNMSGDPEQEYFADGVVEDIITALSRVKRFFVIARNSSFTYKGRAVDVRQVGRELGVRYVLEGSIRRAANKVRITGQLVEAETGNHVWADRFDGALDDIFELQDAVTASVVATIEPRLREAELARSLSKHPRSLDAYDLYLRSLVPFALFTRAGNDEALTLLKEAVKVEPSFGLAHATLAFCHARKIWQGWSEERHVERELAVDAAQRALVCDPDDPEILWRCAFALVHAGRDLERSVALAERSLALNPNSAPGMNYAGWLQVYSGHFEVALARFERVRRLNPLDPIAYGTLTGFAACHFFLGDFEKAVAFARESLSQNPRFVPAYRYLAAAYSHLGRISDAQATVGSLLTLEPTMRITSGSVGVSQPKYRDILAEGLRLAGLPE
jgi:adenylate cyclase